MDKDTASLVVQIFQMAWPVLLPFLMANSRKHEKTLEKQDELERDINGFGKRMASFEERLKQSLTLESLNPELEKMYAILRMQGEAVASIKSSMEAIEKQTNRIDNWLRSQSK